MDDRDYAMLSRKIDELLDLDLSYYKPVQMQRRLATFIARSGCDGAGSFVARIQRDAELLEGLRTMLTINVTEFFRDGSQWDFLAHQVLPEILSRKRGPKIWSAGCSHGGEPFSVAMLLAEAGAAAGCSIVATDIDRRVLDLARAGGPYGPNDVNAVPPALRSTHMREDEDGFWVAPAIRRAVQFRELNLLRDPFPQGVDLILCRNVIIYFTEPVKDDLMVRFQASLSRDGVLFIGATESILNADEMGLGRMTTHFYRKTTPRRARRAA